MRSGRQTLWAAVFFALVTVLMTWPQAIHLSLGASDYLDAKLSAWILHWDYVQTLRDPLNLFQAPILYPARYVLAFSENMYGAAVFGFPLLASGASLVFNYNVILLLGMFLSALCAWALARYVTGDALASLVAGLVYAFLPYKLSQLAHIHMQWGPFLCLVFLFLLRYLDGGKPRDAAWLALFFAWNALACIQYAFFTGFLVAVVLTLEAVNGGPQRGRRIFVAVVAMGLASLACLPFAIPYKKASDLYGMKRSIQEMTLFSAKPGYFLSAGDPNKLWGPLTTHWRGYEGDFFPGLTALGLAVAAVVLLRRRGAGRPPPRPRVSPRRRLAARLCDGGIVIAAACWLWARTHPHFRVGPLSLGDPGRIQVVLTLAILVRLAFAFPGNGRFASLGDFLKRPGLDRRALLLLIVGATGIVVCLGGRTPYYRFLFQSFGTVFGAVRAVARGVVLFQVALAVLAAWGLSLWTRGRSRSRRIVGVAASVVLIIVEYRAFPIHVFEFGEKRVAVYEWLRTIDLPGGVVEWPFGFPHDCEYTLRQAEHGKPIVNGHSSFSPRPYGELHALFYIRPIPEAVWRRMAALRGSILIYHPHEMTPLEASVYRDLLRRGLASRQIQLLGSFPHARYVDFAFRLAGAPRFDPQVPRDAAERAARDLDAFFAVSESELSPPFGVMDVPVEGATIAPGSGGAGWALDDSGIAEIRIATESGAAGQAWLFGSRPDIQKAYPDYADSGHAGFGFVVPRLPPGAHQLIVTLVGKDGGEAVLRRQVQVR